MHISFTKHDPRISSSSKGILEYLEKENYGREKNFEDLEESTEFDSEGRDSQIENQNLFFTNVKDAQEVFVSLDKASQRIDNNLSYRSKENESKFFMLNISPGLHEIQHLNKIVDLELQTKGIGVEEQEVLNKTEDGKKYLELIKNDLVHQTLREYTRDVMRNYAENFDRNVYQSPENLPNQKEEKEINGKAKSQLEKEGILPENDEYLKKYQELREQFAMEIGKDFSVRKMNENDLVWFGKVEEKRTYKGNDSYVIGNKKKEKLIKKLDYSSRDDIKKEIEDLRRSLFKDRVTNEVIREGMAKGGQQYHVHVIVSRYDNCPDRRHRKSISPLANHRGGTVANKNIAVGFDRDNFFKTAEHSFDKKFRHQRTRSYENYNQQKKQRKEALAIKTRQKPKAKKQSNNLSSQVTSYIKKEVLQNAGIQELSKLNIMKEVNNQLGFRIPMSIPKTPLEASIKIVKAAIGKVLDAGKGY